MRVSTSGRAGIGLALVLSLATGCGGGATSAPDAATIDAGFPYAPWVKELPAATAMGVRRGLTPARGLVHLHSPFSHDACDGAPRATDGTLNAPCLADLRTALCAMHEDFAALTDHKDTMSGEPWGQTLFLFAPGDELVTGTDGMPFASRMACPDGHKLLLFVGGENALMPIMLHRHPDGDATARHAVYAADDAATVAIFRGLGGLAWVAHTEDKDLQHLRDLAPDGFEVFNIHAALDATIRSTSLGLNGPQAIKNVADFIGDPSAEPDLAALGFFDEQTVDLTKWDTLLGEGRRIVGTGGTDAHEDAFPIAMRDGERGDSYRRMMRWLANVALVADPTDPTQIEDALGHGRSFVVFEVHGTPVGFDLHAELSGGRVAEMGDEVTVADTPTIVATTPTILGLDPTLPAPAIETRIFRIDQAGTTLVAHGTGEQRVAATVPGVYRAEVRIVPHHLGPYLGGLAAKGYADHDYPWIYANPIYVRP